MTVFSDLWDDLSSTASPEDFHSIFSEDSGMDLVGAMDLHSLSAHASEVVEYVRLTLGEGRVHVELSNRNIFAAFESAHLRYSSIINMYQAQSWFASLLGTQINYTQSDISSRVPQPSLEAIKKLADAYTNEADPYVGSIALKRCVLPVSPGRQDYNLYSESYVIPADKAPNTSVTELTKLSDYLLSLSGNVTFAVKKVHYYREAAYGRYVDPYSAFMWLDNFQYGANNFVSALYLTPIWQDVLRMTMLKTSDQVRRADHRFSLNGEAFRILPVPSMPFNIYFEAIIKEGNDEYDPLLESLTGTDREQYIARKSTDKYVTGLHNVPFREITYAELNPASRHWVRMYTIAICKEILSRIRGKFTSWTLPNGSTVTTDADSLKAEAESEKTKLEAELKEMLEKTTHEAMLEREAKNAANLEEIWKRVPMGILVR